jgi:hypothetical protein
MIALALPASAQRINMSVEHGAEGMGHRVRSQEIENFEFVLRTPTLRAGSQFRIANCEFTDFLLDSDY